MGVRTSRFFLLAVVILAGCACVDQVTTLDENFYGDLSSENNRIASVLFLDVFGGSLDTLTYDFYIGYLGNHEAPSAQGLTAMIRKADERYFKTKKDAFLIVLHFRNARKIVGDNSETSRIDTVIAVQAGTIPPSVGEVAEKMAF